VIKNTEVSQGGVATRLRKTYCKLTAECTGKRILKIGQHLMKLSASRMSWLVILETTAEAVAVTWSFFGDSCQNSTKVYLNLLVAVVTGDMPVLRHCWLCDRQDIRAAKSRMLVMISLELCTCCSSCCRQHFHYPYLQ